MSISTRNNKPNQTTKRRLQTHTMSSSHVAFLSATPFSSNTYPTNKLTTCPLKTSSQPYHVHCLLHPSPKTQLESPQIHPDRINRLYQYVISRACQDIQIVKSHCPSPELILSTLALSFLLAFPALAEIPSTSQVIFDETGLINKPSISLIQSSASAIQRNSKVSVHFVFVRSISFEDSLSSFAEDIAQSWNLSDHEILFAASPKLARAGIWLSDDLKSTIDEQTATSIAEETFAEKASTERYGAAWLDVCNRLIPILAGEQDPGPPVLKQTEVVQNFKTKQETKQGRDKYVKVVGAVLLISIIAPLLQTYWYVKDD